MSGLGTLSDTTTFGTGPWAPPLGKSLGTAFRPDRWYQSGEARLERTGRCGERAGRGGQWVKKFALSRVLKLLARREGPEACKVGESDAGDVAGHLEGVGSDVDLGAVDLVPGDGDLGDFKVELDGEKKELDVEGPAFDMQRSKDGQRGGPLEEFEAALCVLDSGDTADDGDDEVKAAHEDVPERGPLGDGVGVDHVRAWVAKR